MKSYYSDLATSALRDAISSITKARQYAADAHAPEWLLKNLRKASNGLQNRIDDILILRKPDK